MKKLILASILVLGLLPTTARAQVVVRVGPPPVVVEHPVPPPSPRYIWVGGYYRWTGVRYVWSPGHYVIPPRPRVAWVPAHWVARGGGWVFIGGHWR